MEVITLDELKEMTERQIKENLPLVIVNENKEPIADLKKPESQW
jgi:hypothetical protein